MKRFYYLVVLFIVIFPAVCFANNIYEITVYHFKDATQETALDTYLQTAYIPALHRQQIKSVGIFKPIANDTAADKLIYIITPLKSLAEVQALPKALMNDLAYMEAGKNYLSAVYNNPPYTRMEKILLTAFEKAPAMQLPKLTGNRNDQVYELRSYESPTENYHISKVKMFNTGDEVGIFSRLNFNGVFYGDVIAGSHMPNLMYLTCFNNMAERDKHWQSFSDDAAVKKLFATDEYKNNVSKADIILMHAAAYSDY